MTGSKDIVESLGRYFAEARRRALFAYGTRDCCLEPANWVRFAAGIDPAADYRGKYDDEAGALAFLETAGGVLKILDRAMTGTGLRREPCPIEGDVGCITLAGETIGSIRVPGGWSVISGRGRLVYPDHEVRFHMGWSFQ
jgi:hypothetical protein